MGKPTRRHHFVPQFYLRGFASGGQVHCARLANGSQFSQSVDRAAMETDLYRLEGHPDGPDAFEKAMASSTEAEASVALRQLTVAGVRSLSLEQRASMAQFIALQAVRGPEASRNLAAVRTQMVRLEVGYGGRANVADWAQKRFGKTISDQQAQELWDLVNSPLDEQRRLPPEMHVQHVVGLMEELWPYIMGRPWLLIRFQKRSLFTSDCPVGLVRSEEDWENPFMGVGFATAWGITVPLSRKLGLLLCDPMQIEDMVDFEFVAHGKADYETKGTTAYARLFNEHTAGAASEWLFCHPDDAAILPDPLPTPNLVSMRMSGVPEVFTERSPFAKE